MKRVLVLLIGPSRVASSRVRVLQHLPALAQQGAFRPTVLAAGSVLDRDLPRPLAWLLGVWLKRWRMAIVCVRTWFARPFALVVVHRLLLPPWLTRRLVRLGVPILFDFDDALAIEGFHRPEVAQQRFHLLLEHAAHVTTSTEWNAAQVRPVNPRVTVVMSSVNTARQPWKRARTDSAVVAIGWIGSPSTAPYLEGIAEPLTRLGRERPLRMLVVGGDPDWTVPGVEVIHRRWTERSESNDLLAFDIGVMPLPDNEWTRGKGGFKLIQYMAAGLPVVASPVGVNPQLVSHGTNGYLASTPDEWFTALRTLAADPALRRSMGASGRARAEERYDAAVAQGQLQTIINALLKT